MLSSLLADWLEFDQLSHAQSFIVDVVNHGEVRLEAFLRKCFRCATKFDPSSIVGEVGAKQK